MKLEDIKFSSYSSVSKQKRADQLQIIGYDTETLNGYCRLLCNSKEKWIYPKTIDEILEYLVDKENHKALKIFYNLKYDTQAIIKYLPYEQLVELAFQGECKYKEYTLRYIAEKVFSVKYKHLVYKFYDIAQFYHMSLDAAGKKYLNETKDNYDVTNLKEKDFDPKNTIFREYCIQDCILTQRLGERLERAFRKLDISFDTPISSARLSEIYTMNHTRLPPFRLRNFQKMYWNSYAGGRFELIERGYQDNVYLYDINSAYPAVIKDLPHMDYTTAYKLDEYDKHYPYGVYHIRVNQAQEEYISPLWEKRKGLLVFPNATQKEYYLTQKEIEYINKNTTIDYEVIQGYGLLVWEKVKPFKWIEDLYQIRKEVEQDDPEMAQTIKIIMNSLYGKFLQTTRVWKKTELDPLNNALTIINEDIAIAFKDSIKGGYLFNPFYASTITSNTRIKLLDTIKNHQDKVIAMHTDSIAITKRKIHTKTGLGNWSLEKEGEGIFVNTGMYTIRGDNTTKHKFRGGTKAQDKDWFQLCKENAHKKEIVITKQRPLNLKETILHHNKHTVYDLNKFITREKIFHIDQEHKRQWHQKNITYQTLLTEKIQSNPLAGISG